MKKAFRLFPVLRLSWCSSRVWPCGFFLAILLTIVAKYEALLVSFLLFATTHTVVKWRPSTFVLFYLPDFFSTVLQAIHRNLHFLPYYIKAIFDLQNSQATGNIKLSPVWQCHDPHLLQSFRVRWFLEKEYSHRSKRRYPRPEGVGFLFHTCENLTFIKNQLHYIESIIC